MTSENKTPTQSTSCPNCSATWGVLEREFQSCDKCGYPLHKGHEKDHSNKAATPKKVDNAATSAPIRRGG